MSEKSYSPRVVGLWRIRQWWQRRRERSRLAQALCQVAAFPSIAQRRAHGLAHPLVVSLTSYPARFPTLALTLRSLLDQTVAPDRTVLWVDHAALASLPGEVRALESAGLEIRGCTDLRSFTKLVPALHEWPDASIVTADDDIHYASDWLEQLVAGSREQPGAIICHRAHMARTGPDGKMLPYAAWQIDCDDLSDRSGQALLFPTGVGGVLYPPGSLAAETGDAATFLALCPAADDVWFFWMAELAGTPQVRFPGRNPLVCWAGTQEVGLGPEQPVGRTATIGRSRRWSGISACSVQLAQAHAA